MTVYGPHCSHEECSWITCDLSGLVEFPCRVPGCPHCGAPPATAPEHWASAPARFAAMSPAAQERARAYWRRYPLARRPSDGPTATDGRLRRAMAAISGTDDGQDWASARTLRDLGQFTALWLEGDLATVPGYSGRPAAETAPLVPVLAALNRAGYLTSGSQPGTAGRGADGAWWEQRAAVEGFAGPRAARMLTTAARAADLIVITHDPARLPRRRIRYRLAVPVTRRDGQPVTTFGAHWSRRHLRDPWTGYGACHRHAVDEVCRAWQLTVIDPQWGRPGRLWRVLHDTVTQGGCLYAPEVTP